MDFMGCYISSILTAINLTQVCYITSVMYNLCNPMDGSPPGSSVHGILQARKLGSGWPCPPPGDLPDPGIESASLMSPALAGGFFAASATWESP